MRSPIVQRLAVFAAGGLFGAGLVVSGMTRPEKVLSFLDPLGRWDPSLMLVMVAAVAVHFLAYRVIRGWRAPLFAEKFEIPAGRPVTLRLVSGAVLFGVGWGFAGYCPGPSVVSLASGGRGIAVFIACLLLGVWLASRWESRARSAEQGEPRDGGTVAA